MEFYLPKNWGLSIEVAPVEASRVVGLLELIVHPLNNYKGVIVGLQKVVEVLTRVQLHKGGENFGGELIKGVLLEMAAPHGTSK